MGEIDTMEQPFGAYNSLGSPSGHSTASETPVNRRPSNFSRSASFGGNFDPGLAAQQAKVLAWRRRTSTSTSTAFENEGADSKQLSQRTDSKAFGQRTDSKQSAQRADSEDLSELREALFLCKTSLLKECVALHKKLDWVITHNEKQDKVLSHMRNSFNRLALSSAIPSGCSATSKGSDDRRFEDMAASQSTSEAKCKELRQVATNASVTTETVQVTSHPMNGRFDMVSLAVPSKPAVCLGDEMRNHEPHIDEARSPRPGSVVQSVRSDQKYLKSSSSGSFNKFLLSRIRHRNMLLKLIWVFLEDPELMPRAVVYHRMTTLLVLVSCALMIAQTSESPPFGRFTENVVACTVDGFITTEIMLRFAACPNRPSFFLDIHNVIDLANGPVILMLRITFFVAFSGMPPQPQDTVHTLLNSFFPILRLLKILRRFESAHLIFTALARASEVLPMLIYVLVVIITAFASILYGVEPRENIESLPDACWFAIVTLSTVGYGDMTPVTPQGKFVVGTLIVMAAVYMAMPIGIVGKVFSEVWDDRTSLLLTQLARRRFKIAGYTPAEIPGMFLSFDRNSDGVLCVAEFTEMMKEMQFDVSGKRVSELFNVFDNDGNGSISDREFLELLFPDAARQIYGDSNSSCYESELSSPVSGHEAPNRQSSSDDYSEVISELGDVEEPQSGVGRDALSVPSEKVVGEQGDLHRPEFRVGCDAFSVPGEKDGKATLNGRSHPLPIETACPPDSIRHPTQAAAGIAGKAEAVAEAVSQADGHGFDDVEGEPVQAIQISNMRLQSSSLNMGTHYMPTAVGYVASDDSSDICPAPIEMDGSRHHEL